MEAKYDYQGYFINPEVGYHKRRGSRRVAELEKILVKFNIIKVKGCTDKAIYTLKSPIKNEITEREF